MFRLLAALTADAALTVASMGIYPAIRAGEGERSFTGQVLHDMKKEKENKQMVEALKAIAKIQGK